MKSDFVFFWGSENPFSNWYQPNNFTHNGVLYNCSEQAMMHLKALRYSDLGVASLIMEQTNPRKQKFLGREVRGFNKAEWTIVCQDVMFPVLLDKFTQDELLKEYILSTGDKIIAEASPVDAVWGIGLAEDNYRAWNQATWEGTNFLGNVLMRVRDEIRG